LELHQFKISIHLYCIYENHFQSRLFKCTIKKDSPFYWQYLYAEILFRLKELAERQCPCKKCYINKHNLVWRISEMENDGKIEKNFRPPDDKAVGYCGRAELPPGYYTK
jgi:hypothetical protein